jgi:glycosyltransferase involved in cell wall biosynthesis
MSKIKVLVFPSDRSGVSKFRSVEPHMKLQELYNDDFYVEIITAGTNTFSWDDEYIKKFDIIHFHRTLPTIKNGRIEQVYLDDVRPIIERVKKLGIITVMDLDDYWEPSKDHPAHSIIIREKLPFKITENLKMVDYVTTTTPIFAKEISKYNKNVIVLPNAVDPTEKQFKPNTEESKKNMRLGWLGGSSHFHDLTIIGSHVSRFLGENKTDSQMVLCGFDVRGNVTEIDKNTGQQRTRKIKPEESVWTRYEEMFTNKYKLIEPQYLEQLKRYEESSDKQYDNKNEIYRRVWTKPITSYASNYNLFDISMAPLKEHDFNRCKSQLKVIESGFHKKALIAQNYGPYQIDCVNLFEYGGGINENGNAILIDTHKNHKDWYKAMKKLKDNPSLVELLSNNLYNTVKDKYSIDTVTHSRASFYKTIIEDSKNEVEQLIEHTNAI